LVTNNNLQVTMATNPIRVVSRISNHQGDSRGPSSNNKLFLVNNLRHSSRVNQLSNHSNNLTGNPSNKVDSLVSNPIRGISQVSNRSRDLHFRDKCNQQQVVINFNPKDSSQTNQDNHKWGNQDRCQDRWVVHREVQANQDKDPWEVQGCHRWHSDPRWSQEG